MFLASILGNGFYTGSIYSVKRCLLLYILNLLPHNFSKCPLDLKLEKMKNPSPFIQFVWFMIVQISPTCSPAVILSQTEKSQVSQSLSLLPQPHFMPLITSAIFFCAFPDSTLYFFRLRETELCSVSVVWMYHLYSAHVVVLLAVFSNNY